MNTDREESASTWWSAMVAPANRAYAIGAAFATLIAFAAPHAIGTFISCAEFMEVEWVMVAFLCLAGVGALNSYFVVAPKIELFLPHWSAGTTRKVVLFGVPLLVLAGSLWSAFSPFWYALLNDPELLCD